ncbi:MAG: methylated-DNA--[protein]-cysteine S-methyltransferase [Alkalibacterium sp.]|nr:methylated-DNA--[protein]-cysteine S-methyltransferase [Alkalibacterium sp.]TVP93115.1 MAG: methylated-DNA--[protein]-cysteine S-methyltransferase [Alkalibacterium sp.]
MEKTVTYSLISYQGWSFYIAATDEGLCFVGAMPASKSECLNWISSNIDNSKVVYDKEALKPYETAFYSYIDGDSTDFELPVLQIGTSFQKKIWNSLRTVPYGQTITYSELAERSGLDSKAARAVGSAIGKNPLLIIYPCHRVVPKTGKPRAFRGGLQMKEALLELERNYSS